MAKKKYNNKKYTHGGEPDPIDFGMLPEVTVTGIDPHRNKYSNTPMSFVRKNWAENLDPLGYGDGVKKSLQAAVQTGLGNPDPRLDKPWSKVEGDRFSSVKDDAEKGKPWARERQDLLNMLMGESQKYGSVPVSDHQIEGDSTTYYSSPTVEESLKAHFNGPNYQGWKNFYDENGSTPTSVIHPGSYGSNVLGKYNTVLGEDDKGLYVEYNDTWDLNPLSDTDSNPTADKIVTGLSKSMLGFTPPKIRGKVYLEGNKQKYGGKVTKYENGGETDPPTKKKKYEEYTGPTFNPYEDLYSESDNTSAYNNTQETLNTKVKAPFNLQLDEYLDENLSTYTSHNSEDFLHNKRWEGTPQSGEITPNNIIPELMFPVGKSLKLLDKGLKAVKNVKKFGVTTPEYLKKMTTNIVKKGDNAIISKVLEPTKTNLKLTGTKTDVKKLGAPKNERHPVIDSDVPLTHTTDAQGLVIENGKVYKKISPQYSSTTGKPIANRSTTHFSTGHIGDPGHGAWKSKSTSIVTSADHLKGNTQFLDMHPADTFTYNKSNLELPSTSTLMTRDKSFYDKIKKDAPNYNIQLLEGASDDAFENAVNLKTSSIPIQSERFEEGKKIMDSYMSAQFDKGKEGVPLSAYYPKGLRPKIGEASTSKIHGNTTLNKIEHLRPRAEGLKSMKSANEIYPADILQNELSKLSMSGLTKSEIAEVSKAWVKEYGYKDIKDLNNRAEAVYKKRGFKYGGQVTEYKNGGNTMRNIKKYTHGGQHNTPNNKPDQNYTYLDSQRKGIYGNPVFPEMMMDSDNTSVNSPLMDMDALRSMETPREGPFNTNENQFYLDPYRNGMTNAQPTPYQNPEMLQTPQGQAGAGMEPIYRNGGEVERIPQMMNPNIFPQGGDKGYSPYTHVDYSTGDRSGYPGMNWETARELTVGTPPRGGWSTANAAKQLTNGISKNFGIPPMQTTTIDNPNADGTYRNGGDFIAGALGGFAGSIPLVGGVAQGIINKQATKMGADMTSNAASFGNLAGGIGAMAVNPTAGAATLGNMAQGNLAKNVLGNKDLFKTAPVGQNIGFGENGGNFGVDFEAEAGEVVLGDITVDSNYNGGYATQHGDLPIFTLGGKTHRGGGVGVNAKEATIFSNNKKLGGVPKEFGKGVTYAGAAHKLADELANISAMKKGDVSDKNTAKRMEPIIMAKFGGLFDAQEDFKVKNGFSNPTAMAENGGEVEFGSLLKPQNQTNKGSTYEGSYGTINGSLPPPGDMTEEEYAKFLTENFPGGSNPINIQPESSGAYSKASPEYMNPYAEFETVNGKEREIDVKANVNYDGYKRDDKIDHDAFKAGILGPEIGNGEKNYALQNGSGTSAYGPYQILYSVHKGKLKKLYGVESEEELANGTKGRLGEEGLTAEEIQEGYMDSLIDGYEKSANERYDSRKDSFPSFYDDIGMNKADIMALEHFKGKRGATDYLSSVDSSMRAGVPYNPKSVGDTYSENPGAPSDTTSTGEYIYPEDEARNMLVGDYIGRFSESYGNSTAETARVAREEETTRREKDGTIIQLEPKGLEEVRIPEDPVTLAPRSGQSQEQSQEKPQDQELVNPNGSPYQPNVTTPQSTVPRGTTPQREPIPNHNGPLSVEQLHERLGLGPVPQAPATAPTTGVAPATTPDWSNPTPNGANPNQLPPGVTPPDWSNPGQVTAQTPGWSVPAQPDAGSMGPINGDLVGGHVPQQQQQQPANQVDWSNPTQVTQPPAQTPNWENPAQAPVTPNSASGSINPAWTRTMQNRMGITANSDGSSVATTDPLAVTGDPSMTGQGDNAKLPWQLYAANAVPGMFNIAKGLFGKAPTMELDRLEEQEYFNFNPMMQGYDSASNRGLALGRAGLESSGATGAQLRGGYQAMNSTSQANAGQFYNQLAPQMQQSRMATDQFNQGIKQQNQQYGLMEDQFAMQNDPMNSVIAGAEQLVSAGTNLYMDNLKAQNMSTQMYDWMGNFTGSK